MVNIEFLFDLLEVHSSAVTFSANVTSTNDIITSGTYFVYNGNITTTEFVPILDGYNVSYTTTVSGNSTLDLHVQDTVESVVAEYEFNFGYNVVLNEVLTFDSKTQVPIVISASNTAIAPNEDYFSTYFETLPPHDIDLFATIDPKMPEGFGAGDIVAHIYPLSKHFIYGNTYDIVISGIKDFSGNELEATTHTFKIEEL